jgi:hypothetical protein
MRASHLVVGLVAVSLLVVAVAAGSAAAEPIEGTDEAAEEICQPAPDGNSFVIVLPDDTNVYPGEERTRLLPGTTGDLVLCSDGTLEPVGSAWELNEEATTGVNVTASHARNYDITVEDVERSTEITFELSSTPAGGQVGRPAVNATPGQLTTAHLGDNTYQIALNDSQEQRFRQVNGSYIDTLAEINSSAENLNQTDWENIDADNDTIKGWVSNISQTRAVRTNYTELQLVLFESARSGNANAAEALDGYATYNESAFAQASNDLRNTNANLAQETRSTALDVLVNFVGVALVGGILGGIGGRVVTNRILSRVEGKRRRSSAVDFRPKHITGQLLAALVLLAVAVALIVIGELLGPLGAVFGAVIP